MRPLKYIVCTVVSYCLSKKLEVTILSGFIMLTQHSILVSLLKLTLSLNFKRHPGLWTDGPILIFVPIDQVISLGCVRPCRLLLILSRCTHVGWGWYVTVVCLIHLRSTWVVTMTLYQIIKKYAWFRSSNAKTMQFLGFW